MVLKYMGIKLIFVLIMILTIFFVMPSTSHIAVADSNETVIHPKFPADPDPKTFWGAVITTGYTTQPAKVSHVTVGDPLTLETQVKWPIWEPSRIIGYYWWRSFDGNNWERMNTVSLTNKGSKNLKVDTSKPGVTYYFLRTRFITTTYTSKVSTVYVSEKPIDASSINVTTDLNYLFNINSDLLNKDTMAHAELQPDDSNSKIHWSSSDESLATVQPDELITANGNGKSGIVTITGTAENKNGPSISGSKEILIGGGLTNQTVNSGKKATFTLQGGNDEQRDNDYAFTVDWYKQLPNQKPTLVEHQKDPARIEYTTPITSTKDDGAQYYARISVGKNNSVTTGSAKLTVLPPNDPDVNIETSVTNQSFPDKDDSPTTINNVTNDDQLTYNLNLTNNSKRAVHDTYLELPLPLGTEINSITVDGEELFELDYYQSDTDKKSILHIDLDGLDQNQSKSLKIDTLTHDITNKESFLSTPEYYGLDPDGDKYTSYGPELNINYITNKLTAQFKDISFEPISLYDGHSIKHRTEETNDPNPVIKVDDQRRQKMAMRLFLTQLTPFTSDTNVTLPASLRLYNGSTFKNPLYQKTLVSQSHNGNIFNSIIWHKDNGLLLHLDKKSFVSGKYSSKLSWTFEQSI